MNKKRQTSSNCALRRAKRMKQSEVLIYIDPFCRSSYVFSITDNVNEKTLNYESKRGNPISSKEKCLKIANICSTFHLEYF